LKDDSPDDRIKNLRATSQATLIDLLTIDVNLAFTFLETGDITGAPGRRTELIDKADTALESIRRFLPRIEDPKTYQAILERTNQLEAAIRDARA
jgi:hypothetical protein